ncbi:MAG: hypothetical protein HND47_14400 [Chloroflexi bacterium]|nr:hypothetical protein [Chloroflexota bacterium]
MPQTALSYQPKQFALLQRETDILHGAGGRFPFADVINGKILDFKQYVFLDELCAAASSRTAGLPGIRWWVSSRGLRDLLQPLPKQGQ